MFNYPDILPYQLEEIINQSAKAFTLYKQYSLQQRAKLLYATAYNLQQAEKDIIKIAVTETHLSPPRLKTELSRTCWQLNSYADYCKSGQWMDIRIDNAGKGKNTTDLRKMQIPLGPVAIFGAANFPLAYSTAGGDTACALAAGCTVIVKAHPAHAQSSQLIADIIAATLIELKMPKNIFQHLHGVSKEIGKALVSHPLIKAVGFTGSFKGGKQIFDWGQQRPEPIPVFAEMSSVNPVFILQEKLITEAEEYAKLLAASINSSTGQFCTCPGIIVGINNDSFNNFIVALSTNFSSYAAAQMLNQGIFENYQSTMQSILQQQAVQKIEIPKAKALPNEALPVLAMVNAQDFILNPSLMQEVFGPFCLMVKCTDYAEMLLVAQHMQGQLTATIIASENEMNVHKDLIDSMKTLCGRIIFNAVPTGVQVSLAMQHGGPYPATTDSRFTAVGADGIKRFCRPIAYQNWPNNHLPEELKNENPLQLWRTVNNIPGKH